MTETPPVDTPIEIVLRPTWASYTSDIRSRAKWLAPAVLLIFARNLLGKSSGGILAMILVTVVAVVAVVMLVRWHVRSTRVILTPGRIERTGPLVRECVLDVDRLRGLLAVVVQPGTANLTVVLHDDDVGTIRLSDALWSGDDITTIAQHAGVPVITDPVNPGEVNTIIPGSMPSYLRHPWLWGFGIALLITALIVAGTIAWFVVNDLPPWDDHPPAAVSEATIEFEDAAVAAVVSAIPGDWSEPTVTLGECETYDGKGWSRDITLTRDGGDPVDVADMEAAGRALTELQLSSTAVREANGRLTISADGGTPYTWVHLHVKEPAPAFLAIDGACDVPG